MSLPLVQLLMCFFFVVFYDFGYSCTKPTLMHERDTQKVNAILNYKQVHNKLTASMQESIAVKQAVLANMLDSIATVAD